ncbi:hypothetical protein WEB32_33735 [Streptomyces netropsis]|uniref:Uncharacterized protein n=1 Tax=Streptomyces netropsis TaxID=55404 RepID=A0A7W7LGW1_STRNE|nr:hypothetical protein [Streptomyces netropsis]MBB4889702.1 hypothetical protein [Streptomyces netropsis]
MTSFETHRRRVHDASLPVRARHAALRTCVVCFAPYGFRATYHHLCRSARIPADLRSDPASLIRAVEELHAARGLWVADEAAFMARRRQEKAVGRRHITSDGGWRDRGRGPAGSLAYCPDPERHPTEPLPTVLGRILRSRVPAAAASSMCRACGSDAGTTGWSCGHYLHRLCARCGVSLSSQETDADRAVLAAREERWKEVWRRAV